MYILYFIYTSIVMTSGLCKYKSIFGDPNTGAHSYRIFNLAIVDVGATVVVAYLISLYSNYNFWTLLLVLFITGIIMHRMFGVKTTIDKLIFGQ